MTFARDTASAVSQMPVWCSGHPRTGVPTFCLVGADAHIRPPSTDRLPKIARVDVGIDPYNR